MNKIKIALGVVAGAMLVGQVAAQSSFSNSGLEAGSRTVQQGAGGPVVLTQSVDPLTIIAANSVSCNAGGAHADNTYMRRFDLDGEFALSAPFVVEGVDVGIETATGGGASGSQPISVIAYSIANAAPMAFANLVEVGRIDTTIADTASTVQAFAFTASQIDPSTDDLVIEVFTPDGQAVGHSFFIGSNNLGQTAASYIAAAACGITEPTDTAAIGFPGMHIVMSVNGSTAGVVPPPTTAPVPAMSLQGLLLMLLALAGVGFVALKRRAAA